MDGQKKKEEIPNSRSAGCKVVVTRENFFSSGKYNKSRNILIYKFIFLNEVDILHL